MDFLELEENGFLFKMLNLKTLLKYVLGYSILVNEITVSTIINVNQQEIFSPVKLSKPKISLMFLP